MSYISVQDVTKVYKMGEVEIKACDGISFEMERYFNSLPGAGEKVKAERVLELNPEHPAYAAVKAAFEGEDKEKAKKLSKILWVLSEMNAGLEVEDTAEFTDLVSELF